MGLLRRIWGWRGEDMDITTKDLELALYKSVAYRKLGVYFCFEVAMPYEKSITKTYNRERVDALLLEAHNLNYDSGVWRFYELKLTKSDFYSNNKLSFYGNYNYFVIPYELYELVKNDISSHIGVYTVKNKIATCVKKSKKRELLISHYKLVFALMQRLEYEHKKIITQHIYNN